MVAPRAKTLIERFGFNDPELTTPAHDEMFMVCMNSQQNILDLVIESDERFASWRQLKRGLIDHTLICERHAHQEPKQDVFDLLKALSYTPYKTIPERPIVARNDFIIGFIDIFMSVYLGPTSKLLRCTSDGWVIDGLYSRIPGDIKPILAYFNMLIEIKPIIRSVGELIRQMQTYRQFAKGDTLFVVISKTTAFKDILAQANILLIDYSDVVPPKLKGEGAPTGLVENTIERYKQSPNQ